MCPVGTRDRTGLPSAGWPRLSIMGLSKKCARNRFLARPAGQILPERPGDCLMATKGNRPGQPAHLRAKRASSGAPVSLGQAGRRSAPAGTRRPQFTDRATLSLPSVAPAEVRARLLECWETRPGVAQAS